MRDLESEPCEYLREEHPIEGRAHAKALSLVCPRKGKKASGAGTERARGRVLVDKGREEARSSVSDRFGGFFSEGGRPVRRLS